MHGLLALILLTFVVTASNAGAAPAAGSISVTAPWQVTVAAGVYHAGSATAVVKKSAVIVVEAPAPVTVHDEKHTALPIYNPKASGWSRGQKMLKLVAMECTKFGMLDPTSVVVRSASTEETVFHKGVDYDFDPDWATFGRLENGAILPDREVYLDYTYGISRIDAIAVTKAGDVVHVIGIPDVVSPQPPAGPEGSVVIANIWLPGRIAQLTDDNLYQIVEPVYPEKHSDHPPAETLLPKTWAKLKAGQTVNFLAWGDSITAGGAASDVAHRYQERFATMLREKFPNATINMMTSGWGGRGSRNFLEDPPGAAHNFDEQVIGKHPDCVIVEFVNDGWMNADQFEKYYDDYLDRFQKAGIEMIVTLPHYNMHQWMNGSKTDRISEENRPYIKIIRDWATKHNVAIADWSGRWGHLQKEGIPYETLLLNGINHPNNYGHEMFALAILENFGGPK